MTDTDHSPTAHFRFGQVVPRTPSTPPLGALQAFTDESTGAGLTFTGQGFNTIFRPQNAASPTVLANTPVPSAPGAPLPDPANPATFFTIPDNILELNLTEETLTFLTPLGLVPNRGEVQADAFLNGVPYQQVVNDVTDQFLNPYAQATGIHFEPGLWLNVPPTTVPAEGPTVARLASIPHGTTINAQGNVVGRTPGKPPIGKAPITPSFITQPPGATTDLAPFTSQTVANDATFRIPQDLSQFAAAGAITQAILDDPNVLLSDVIAGQNITEFTTLVISTSPAAPLTGGGTDNIAFLLGNQTAVPPAPNAQATQMSAIFWIETVRYEITVPPFTPGQGPLIVSPDIPGDVDGRPTLVPRFRVDPPFPILHPITINVDSTQIQYTQTVILDFAGLRWPHVSVATLIPAHPVPVPRETWIAHPGGGAPADLPGGAAPAIEHAGE